jgi:hypothetical protein
LKELGVNGENNIKTGIKEVADWIFLARIVISDGVRGQAT